MFLEMRDATSTERLPEIEVDVFYNNAGDEPIIEIFLDEPINTPHSGVLSPRLVMSLAEAHDLHTQLGRALGPDPDTKE